MVNNSFGIKISADRKKDLIKIGQHEVSHLVVAKLLGFKTGSISLEVTHLHDGHNGGAIITLYNGLTDLDEIIKYLENRIVVLYSGVIGESLNCGDIDNDYAIKELHKGGKSDFDKSRELIHVLNNIKYPNANNEDEANTNLDTISCELWNKAIETVLAEKEIITGLGSRLASDIEQVGVVVELTNEEINSLPAIKRRFPDGF